MKTGMEYPLFGLVILVVLVGLWNIWSGMQLDLATASLNAMAAGEAAPAPVMIAGQWIVKGIIGTLIGGVATAVVAALIVWVRRQWNANQGEGHWKGGPNANWSRERPAKPVSEVELMRMMMMQQMTQNGRGANPPAMRMEGEDEPVIRF